MMATRATRVPAAFAETTKSLTRVVKRNKYMARKTEVDGIVFHSAKESRRYSELKLLERAGEIHDLKCQPRYDLVVNGHKVCAYVGDFAYLTRTGEPVTEDVKSAYTAKIDTFRVKAKLFRALFGRDIRLV
jgi:hypothetical protein